MGRLIVALVALAFGAAFGVAALLAFRGGDADGGPRVVRLTFTLSGEFSRHGVIAQRGSQLERFARLVELPLPAPLPPPQRRDGCYPATLTIELSDGVRRRYGPCRRPASLLAVSLELCRELSVARTADCERLRRERGETGQPA